jgi:hypothetical protein
MARTVWPGESALGKCVRAGHAPGSLDGDPFAAAATLPCRTVVGVVRDSRARSLRADGDEAKLPQYYVPFDQLPAPPFAGGGAVHAILVRTAGEPERLAAQVQRLIQGSLAVRVFARVRPYQTLIDPQLRSWRLGASLFLAFGALALGIAGVGLAAVMSYLVAQRGREIGVRLAMGGTSATIARLVVWDAIRAREPATVIAAIVILVTVAMLASALPAWRASRVSPLEVLRTDQ